MHLLKVRPIHLALLLWGVVACLMLFGRVELTDRLILTGPDDYIRLLRVENILAGGDWFNTRIERANPPEGIPLHWSPITEAPLVFVAGFASLFVDQAAAVRFAVTVTPIIGLLAVFLIATWAGGWIFGRTGAWLAPISLVYADAVIGQFVPGRIDHHGLQLLLAIGLAVSCIGVIRSPRIAWPMIGGLAAAVSISIGLETLPYIAAFHAALGIAWLMGRENTARSGAIAAGSAALAGLALLFLHQPEAVYFWQACDALSGVFLLAFAATGIGWICLAGVGPHLKSSIWVRAAAGSAVATCVIAVIFIFYPECMAGPYGGVPPQVRDFWLNEVDETQSVLELARRDPGRFLALYWISIIAIAASLSLLIQRSWREDPSRLVLTAFLTISLCIAFWQIRGASFAATYAFMAALPAFIALQSWSKRTFQAPSRWIILGLILLIFSPIGLSALSAGLWTSRGQDRTGHACGLPESLDVLSQQEKGLVGAQVPLGPMVLYFTHHDVLAAPYHRGTDALIKADQLWAAETEKEAEEIIKRFGVDYVLLCDSGIAHGVSGRDALGTFANGLIDGSHPDWLAPIVVSGASKMRLYRVTVPSSVGASER